MWSGGVAIKHKDVLYTSTQYTIYNFKSTNMPWSIKSIALCRTITQILRTIWFGKTLPSGPAVTDLKYSNQIRPLFPSRYMLVYADL